MADEATSKDSNASKDPANSLIIKAVVGVFGTVLAPVLVAMGMKFSDAFVTKVTDASSPKTEASSGEPAGTAEASISGVKSLAETLPPTGDKPAGTAPPSGDKPAPPTTTPPQEDSSPALHQGIKTAKYGGDSWMFSTQQPVRSWTEAKFPAKKWRAGNAPFGTPAAKAGKASVATEWTSKEIWLRKKVNLPPEILGARVKWQVFHDEQLDLYVNGTLLRSIIKAPGVYQGFIEETTVLRPGENLIAVHSQNQEGEGIVDVGFTWEPRSK